MTWPISTPAAGTTVPRSYLEGIREAGDPWSSYAPSWTSTGTNPAIANGSIVGAYATVGQLVVARFAITIGSTTTVGSGVYTISLPVAANAAYANMAIGSAMMLDTSATSYYGFTAYLTPSGVIALAYTSTRWTASNPVAPASGDVISGTVTYEAA